jgi:glycosyltransferase involved in cell wall biosynthesis|tara:strand:- start:268 stop:1239 length:972 start_codon:yes stop_codon:yes gene_type:complete
MKIYILFDFVDGPYGGGNQFLKGLMQEFIRKDCFSDNPEDTNIILFNSHHSLNEVIKLKKRYPDKIFIHRVDGPMVYRGENGKKIDKSIFAVNKFVADGTIFQSEWSRRESHNQGMKKNNYETVIRNAPDSKIFFPPNMKEPINNNRKIKLIATSWSNNPDKGFDIYHYLDENLDFEKYEMTFIGQIDKHFKNIKTLDPLPSVELAEQLRQHDIFIFASKIEACSNSLIEALSCGLPAVVRNCSSNPEVMGKRGLTFNGKDDVISIIKLMIRNLGTFEKMPFRYKIKKAGEKYLKFFNNIAVSDTQRKYIHMFNQLKYWYQKI